MFFFVYNLENLPKLKTTETKKKQIINKKSKSPTKKSKKFFGYHQPKKGLQPPIIQRKTKKKRHKFKSLPNNERSANIKTTEKNSFKSEANHMLINSNKKKILSWL